MRLAEGRRIVPGRGAAVNLHGAKAGRDDLCHDRSQRRARRRLDGMRRILPCVLVLALLPSGLLAQEARGQEAGKEASKHAGKHAGKQAPAAEASAPASDLLRRAEQRLAAADADPSAVLADAAFEELRPDPAFRALVRAHAAAAPCTMVAPDEPGTRLTLQVRVLDAGGEPVRNALVYAYHTNAKGWYAADAPHVAGSGGDSSHARLFAYVRTGDDGRFELRTIRPAGYPRSSLPQHVHVPVRVGDQHVAATEILFDGDDRLTAAGREQAQEGGVPIAEVAESGGGGQLATAELRLERTK